MSNQISEQDAWDEYKSWIDLYYVECDDKSQARIEYDGTTVSEGIGYGLVITAYAGDKDKFDKLLAYFQKRLTWNGVMNWEYKGCDENPSGSGGATDGDLDAAMGLLVAHHQWPDQGYGEQFKTLAQSIRTSEFTDCGLIVQKPGDGWGGCDCTNPSYYAPGYYRAFSRFYKDEGDNDNETFWTQAATDSYVVLFRNQHETSGLVTAWTNIDGDAGPCGGQAMGDGGPWTYQYDACRTPWRIATDYLWWGSDDAKTFLNPIVDFVNDEVGGIENVVSGYYHDGAQMGEWHNTPFVGSFALAGMAISQKDAHNYLKHFSSMKGDNYFNTCLSVMYKFLATGNFWNPYSTMDTSEEVYCSEVDLGSDKTICSSGSVELNANLPVLENREFIWYKDGEEIAKGSENTYTAMQTGIYSVVMDSLGLCVYESQVEVHAGIPEINLGKSFQFDEAVELNASIEGEDLKYTWYKDGDEIVTETEQTYLVKTYGTYSVSVAGKNCTEVSADIIVTKAPAFTYTAETIVIDGIADDEYDFPEQIEKVLKGDVGAPDIAANWKGLWDTDNAYIIVEVTDNSLQNDSDNWWEDDAIEVFIDGDNSRFGMYDGENDFQWGFKWQSDVINAGGSNPANSTDGIIYKMVETINGYSLEVSIPWTTIGITPEAGSKIGFDIAINDDDDGGDKDNKLSWNANRDVGYLNPGVFREVVLDEKVQITTQEINLTEGWNLISIYIEPENAEIKEIFKNASIVKNLEGFYDFSKPEFTNSLFTVEAGKGYLVYNTINESIEISGISAIHELPMLSGGCSLIGVSESASLEDAFGAELQNLKTIQNFEGKWNVDGTATIKMIKNGEAYFIYKK